MVLKDWCPGLCVLSLCIMQSREFEVLIIIYIIIICDVQQGRHSEAENELEKLLGASHAKDAILELSKTQRGDEADTVTIAELLCGRHSRGTYKYKTSFLFIFWSYLGYISEALSISFPQNPLLFTQFFCSCFYWINPICFTTAFWNKRCVLFLFNCI